MKSTLKKLGNGILGFLILGIFMFAFTVARAHTLLILTVIFNIEVFLAILLLCVFLPLSFFRRHRSWCGGIFRVTPWGSAPLVLLFCILVSCGAWGFGWTLTGFLFAGFPVILMAMAAAIWFHQWQVLGSLIFFIVLGGLAGWYGEYLEQREDESAENLVEMAEGEFHPVSELNLQPASQTGGGMRFLIIIRDIVIVWIVSGIGSIIVMITEGGPEFAAAHPERDFLATLVSRFLLGTVAFAIVGCLAPPRRWRHLGFVAFGAWITSLIAVVALSGRVSLAGCIQGAIFAATIMGLGGAISYLFKRGSKANHTQKFIPSPGNPQS